MQMSDIHDSATCTAAHGQPCGECVRVHVEEIAKAIAEAIRIGDQDVGRVKRLLIDFAKEIKRQAIEP